MKVVILAGGLGTRLSEETHSKPKPMLEIGGRPILWHIMKIYSSFGFNDFIICAGYKGYLIKEYFNNYFLHNSDVTFDMQSKEIHLHDNSPEPWKVTVIDTGENTMTGGRLKRVQHLLNSESFCMTYGDGVSDINIKKLVDFHKSHKKKATLTAVIPPARYGALELEGPAVTHFKEKPQSDDSWINGGFFVLEPSVIDLIPGDHMHWETEPLEALAQEGQLCAYKHQGFWRPMDTLRDKLQLESIWNKGQAPWKLW
ncbi:glucose-1-phosphate cytidylyltransferase [Pelagicoccus sp. SDUM812005]|uniref:glucose-1-phosphate cytidylyltransferase n=1 Tax=Pelagicoccus sp. SDUM812005 TaxID=3041257 RepID=UPI00280F5DC1|nr:glucose-1-phosphate cytidylyltransferase [Pelagicoccus sp. SDUM812005]MDQ8180936.1 glucose-1-phosphate cytidylyltransferase [Pelagicoccus sp. SDUM812005]